MHLDLRPYQTEDVGRFVRDGRLILAYECGVGKTLVAIEATHALRSFPALVLCNKTARAQWEQMILDQYPHDDILIADKVPWNYELLRAQGNLQWVVAAWDELTLKSGLQFQKLVWPIIVADEVHKAKNRNASRTTALKKIDAVRKLGLSATPYEKSDEVWSLLNWLDRYKFPGYHAFCAQHFTMVDNYWSGRKEAGNLLDPDAFRQMLAPWVLGRTKAEVLPNLPPKIEIDVRIRMTEEQRIVYNEIAKSKDVVVTVNGQDILVLNALAMITKLQQVSTTPELIGIGFTGKSAKIEWVIDHVRDHPERKVVFFTRFKETAKKISHIMKCECIADGGGSALPFKQGEHRYVAGTIDSMGESLDFPMADDAVFVEFHWSSIKMQQAIDRIHRGNITTPKNIYYLHASPTDRRILKCSREKIDEREMALGFVRAPVTEVLDTG